jgi:hypothetical protein
VTCNILNATKVDLSEKKKKHIPYYLIPGLGQIKNKKIVKSMIIIGAEVAAINYWLLNSSIYKNYDDSNPGRYELRKNRYLEKRNKYAWWIGIIYFYSMLDSIVDKHFIDFNEVMNNPIENPTKTKKEIIDEK